MISMCRSDSRRRYGLAMALTGLFLLAAPVLRAQEPPESAVPRTPDPDPDPIPVTCPHPETDRLWISGQSIFISQWHPAFHSPYQGRNSLSPEPQDASSRVLALYTGLRLNNSAEVLCDVQETGGHGIGEALGLAGFTNLDVVRNPTLSKASNIGRLMWHQVISLSPEVAPSLRTPLSLFSRLPLRRLEIRFGKMGLADFFDFNTYGTDSNFQFMNWTVDNSGAYDYAADTRGFTFAAMLEYHDRHWAARFAEGLMPKVANGIHLDADLGRAHSENMELEFHRALILKQVGVLRLLAYVNHANMGSYRQAIDNFRAGLTPVPDITAHPLQTTIKYGRENTIETYYTLHAWRGVYPSFGFQYVAHPGYNRDRGPVLVPTLRLHLEF